MASVTIGGGGVVGCVAAFQVARAGHTVHLYEPRHLGAGASGQALGLLVPSTGTRPLDELQRAGCAAWPEILPALTELADMSHAQLFRPWPAGGQLNLDILFEAFAQALSRLQVKIIKQPLPPKTMGPTLMAMGWGNRDALPAMSIRAGVACKVLAPGFDELTVGRGETQGLYAVPAWDGAVLLGTESWNTPFPHTGPVPEDVLQKLMGRAALLHPALKDAQVLQAWVGNRPTTSPRLPLVRSVEDNQWAVAGLGGLGYALAPMVAREWLGVLGSEQTH